MTGPAKPSLFVARKSYRRRRMRDVARVLPVVGLLLWLVPLLWSGGDGAPPTTATALQYIFGVWLLLIVLAAILSRRLTGDDDRDDNDPGDAR